MSRPCCEGCPSGKMAYATPGDAARAVEIIAKRARHSNSKARKIPGSGRLMHYRCRMCGEWHIGHSPRAVA